MVAHLRKLIRICYTDRSDMGISFLSTLRRPLKTYTSSILLILSLHPTPGFTASITTQQVVFEDGFRPELILQDDDIFQIQGMNQKSIQKFLDQKGALGKYSIPDIDGKEKSAAEIIWRIATSYKINPKYLLALMQKEQSLIEDQTIEQRQLDWATGFGVCDSCSTDDPAVKAFKGFAAQLEWAAKQHREKYLLQILGKGSTIAGYAPGKPAIIDGETVIPANAATAMLYSYTPHFHGNQNLWRIWNRWYSIAYPEGTIVETKETKEFYLLKNGVKKPLKNAGVAASMIDLNKIVRVNASDIAGYPEGDPIAFSNFSLVRTPDKKIFLLSGEKKRRIVNTRVFAKLGFQEEELIDVKTSDIATYQNGPDITATSTGLLGLVVKEGKTYWYVENEERHKIPDTSLLQVYFKRWPIKTFSSEKLSRIPIGEPFNIRDGELVKSPNSSAVFVIEHGKRRPILSGATFEELGWNWQNVVTLPATLLNGYAIGDPIKTPATDTLSTETSSDASTSSNLPS